MTWIRLGDEFADDADAAGLSDTAVRTHIDALAWSNRRLLDLRVPKKDLARFAFSPDAEIAVDELEAAEWWTSDGDAWLLTYHPEWQQTRDQVVRERDLKAQRQRRWLDKKKSETRRETRLLDASPNGAPAPPRPEGSGEGGVAPATPTPPDDDEPQEPPPPAADSLATMRRVIGAAKCNHHPTVSLRRDGTCTLPSCPTNTAEAAS